VRSRVQSGSVVISFAFYFFFVRFQLRLLCFQLGLDFCFLKEEALFSPVFII